MSAHIDFLIFRIGLVLAIVGTNCLATEKAAVWGFRWCKTLDWEIMI